MLGFVGIVAQSSVICTVRIRKVFFNLKYNINHMETVRVMLKSISMYHVHSVAAGFLLLLQDIKTRCCDHRCRLTGGNQGLLSFF